jgi:lysophospholipase L1-like esterase
VYGKVFRVQRVSRSIFRILLGIVFLVAAVMAASYWKDSRTPSATISQDPPEQEPAPYVGKLSFLALGDSYTIGQSIVAPGRWPRQLAARLRKSGVDTSDPVIIARTGWTTGNLLSAIDEANLSQKFNLVMLLIGTNNQFQGRPQDEYRAQFDTLVKESIALADGKTARVIVLSMPDWGVTPFAQQYNSRQIGDQIDQFNAINRQESLKAGVAYIDITPASRGVTTQPDLLADDGLHYSAANYAQWVDACLASAIKAATAP